MQQNKTLCTCHLDVSEVVPVVLEATADKEEPEKGRSKDSLESSESSNVSPSIGGDRYERSQVG